MKNFLKNEFQKVTGWLSLTPALSRWERGNRSPSPNQSATGFGSLTHRFYGAVQRLFPLPAGEGQGEGERTVKNHWRILTPPDFNLGVTS